MPDNSSDVHLELDDQGRPKSIKFKGINPAHAWDKLEKYIPQRELGASPSSVQGPNQLGSPLPSREPSNSDALNVAQSQDRSSGAMQSNPLGVPAQSIQEYQQQPPQKPPIGGAYLDYLMNNPKPMKTDYKPSIGRRIGAAILGGFAGIHDPKTGAQVAGDIVDKPYNQALAPWQERLDRLKEATGEEDKQQRLSAYEEERKAKAKQEMALADLERNKVEHPEVYGRRAASANVKAGVIKDAMGNWSPASQGFDEKTGLPVYKDAAGKPIPPELAATFQAHEQKESNPNPYLDWKAANPNKSVNDYWKENASATGMDVYRAGLGAQQQSRIPVNEAETKKLQQSTPDDAALENHAKRAETELEYMQSLTGENRKQVENYMASRGRKVPIPLDTGDKKMYSSSLGALQKVTNLEKLMTRNPKDFDAVIGALSGRISKAGEVIGSIPWRSPEQEQLAQELLETIKFAVSAEAQSNTGTVARKFALDYFGKSGPDVHMSKDRIIGAIRGIKVNNNTNIDVLKQKSLGSSGDPKSDKVNQLLEEYLKSLKAPGVK